MKGFLRKKTKFFSNVCIDYSLILFLILSIVIEEVKIYFLFLLFIVLHELVHFFVAKRYGYMPQKIKFTVFGAALEGYDDFFVKDEFKIIISGPLFNFAVMIFCYLSFWFYPESFEFLDDILVVNKAILFFNLLPVFPLDSGRIILCFLSYKFRFHYLYFRYNFEGSFQYL